MTVMSAEALDECRCAPHACAGPKAPERIVLRQRILGSARASPLPCPAVPKVPSMGGWVGERAGVAGLPKTEWSGAPSRARAGDLLEAIRGAGRRIIDPTTGEADLEEELPAPDRSGARGWGSDAPATDSPRRNLFDTGAGRCHLLRQVQQRKGGDPMSHVMVARLAPANETLVTSARIG
jgi:hypothetical protein